MEDDGINWTIIRMCPSCCKTSCYCDTIESTTIIYNNVAGCGGDVDETYITIPTNEDDYKKCNNNKKANKNGITQEEEPYLSDSYDVSDTGLESESEAEEEDKS